MDNWLVISGLFAVMLLAFGGAVMVASSSGDDISIPTAAEYGMTGTAVGLCPLHDPECYDEQNQGP